MNRYFFTLLTIFVIFTWCNATELPKIEDCQFAIEECFQTWMEQFDKTYSDEEYLKRLVIFSSNVDSIVQRNKQSQDAVFGLNKFSDLSVSEFKHRYLMNVPDQETNEQSILLPPISSLPTSFDWRKITPPVITPVKNQEQCGSCWAESATATCESYWALAGNPLIELSVQQSVDCCSEAYGCMGGWPSWAYESLIAEGGLETEASYPYVAVNQHCRFNSSKIAAKIVDWATVTSDKNETLMQQWVATQGPLSVCVDASTWSSYKGGIIMNNCGTWIDHCVQIVGYGVSEKGIPFWNVRNSWGTDWGQDGYLQVYRGNDTCAIAQVVTVVSV